MCKNLSRELFCKSVGYLQGEKILEDDKYLIKVLFK